MEDKLQLADFRRRVATLYLTEPIHGVEGWEVFRRTREQLFRQHAQSALPREQRDTAELAFFPYDPSAQVITTLGPSRASGQIEIDTGGEDGTLRYERVSELKTPYGSLTLFWLLGYGGGLFLPFRDGTSGKETYGGGRYLTDTIKGTYGRGLRLENEQIILDFNYAYNPSCAYDSRFACPLAPFENWLTAPVRAGELAYPVHD